MVSTLNYPSHKNPALSGPWRIPLIVGAAVLIVALLVLGAKRVLWPLGLAYLALGPVVTIYRYRKRAAAGRAESPAQAEPDFLHNPPPFEAGRLEEVLAAPAAGLSAVGPDEAAADLTDEEK